MSALTAMGTILVDVFGSHQRLLYLSPAMAKARTPVSLPRMLPWLDHYPDRTMARLLTDGFQGMRFGQKFTFCYDSPNNCPG